MRIIRTFVTVFALLVWIISCSVDNDAALINAVEKEDAQQVDDLLEKGADANAHSEDGISALTKAVTLQNAQIVRLLLQAGADANAAGEDGATPLSIAVSGESAEIVQDLLENDAWITKKVLEKAESEGTDDIRSLILRVRGELGMLLSNAIEDSDTEEARLLLSRGAAIDRVISGGRTYLIRASITGNAEIAKSLINAGADVDAMSARGKSALAYAAESGFLDVARVLIDAGARAEAITNDSLQDALSEGHVDIVRLLIESGAAVNLVQASWAGHKEKTVALVDGGADVNAMDEDENTALMKASEYGLTEIVELLLEKGADVNALKWRQYSPLKLASMGGHVEVMQLLIDAGAEVNVVLRDGQGAGKTALIAAVKKGNTEAVRLLVAAGAGDRNIAEPLAEAAHGGHIDILEIFLGLGVEAKAKNSALTTAAANGQVESAKMLLDHGAQIDMEYLSRNALGYAARNGHAEVVRLLLESPAVDVTAEAINAGLKQAAVGGRDKIVGVFLDRGANANSIDSFGSPLIYATSGADKEDGQNRSEVIKLLIDSGADVNYATDSGDTALMKAAFYRLVDSSRLLLAAGAEIDRKNDKGQTALMIVANGADTARDDDTRKKIEELIGLLAEAGADLDIKDTFGRTPLYDALYFRDRATARVLIEAGADLDAMDSDERTALMTAAARGDIETAKLLIGAGADTEAADSKGVTALALAEQNNKREIVLLFDMMTGALAFLFQEELSQLQPPFATSSFTDEKGNVYSASLSFDGDTQTHWIDGAQGAGVGEKIVFLVPNDQSGIALRVPSGDQKDSQNLGGFTSGSLQVFWAEYEWKNSWFDSLEKAKLTASFELNLESTMEMQEFRFGHFVVPQDPYTHLVGVLEITGVHDESRENTAITEIDFLPYVWEDFMEGTWHDGPMIPAGYGTRFFFNSNGSYEYAPHEMSIGEQDSSEDKAHTGVWRREGNTLFLTERGEAETRITLGQLTYDESFRTFQIEMNESPYWYFPYLLK